MAAYSLQTRNAMTSPSRKPRIDRKTMQRIDRNRQKLETLRAAYEDDLSQILTTSNVYNAALFDLPIRMGRPIKPEVLPPRAAGNIELLKIPNFFHLTPQKVRRDTDALKALCNAWPSKIKRRPIRIYSRNYLYAGPSVAHPKSHFVKLEVNINDLPLNESARKRLMALAGNYYDAETNLLTLVGNKCPTRKQNREYVMYLLTALILESKKC
ncbi:uncharacterized protein TRIADDRAFT_31814 [Trichoplax adhaerens]|uniref:Small ribosomal subunit protein mS35 mitochondrial conserved domain-containing protein n=1 Tax=Trichoplax adhaerens TaxID=10228 RepID=B3S9M2_TRIAD|nr:hypothetical protein TRIADDRAFT_31814 [Trichoplax adhaerens]EDV20498.1 hypothetical protein TRIADDRAFT_31814 [Trichoplax adhaerens]|eukprot:XP_002116924.1 hypothetical protein TRIADDRAFT_31814 [Trichoplax adhaerens]